MSTTTSDRTTMAPRRAVDMAALGGRGRVPVGVVSVLRELRAHAEILRKYGAMANAAAVEAAADAMESAVGRPVEQRQSPPDDAPRESHGWRDEFWRVAPETRLGVREVAEALGRGTSFVYKHTCAKGTRSKLPHRKLDGALVFLAGEVRDWLLAQETVISTGVRPLHSARPTSPRLTAGVPQ